MAKQSDLTWVEIDPTTLEGNTQNLYLQYKDAYKFMKEARQEFESSMQYLAPEGKRLVFGYNFGKLSVAIADKVPEKAKPQKQSLADYLKAQQASGHRC